MRERRVKLGRSEFPVAMPLGALDDLQSQGVDLVEVVTAGVGRSLPQSTIRKLIDVAGAWGADPDRGKPARDAGALTFAMVYADEEYGGLMAAVEIAQQIVELAFVGASDGENPLEGEEAA